MRLGWRVTRVERTGSTNADVAAAARAGAAGGAVLVAGEQTAGRGRLGRAWSSPPGTSLSCSVLLRPPPTVPPARWTWLPLLTGVAVTDALPAVGATLKWPNDVLVSGHKLAGILVERVDAPAGPAAVVGVGVNVAQLAAALVSGSTSLRALGALPAPVPADAVDAVLTPFLDALGRWYEAWIEAGGDPGASGVGAAYRARCDTLEREVRVERPGAEPLLGTAVAVDDDGRLVLASGGVRTAVSAGDVVHVRPR